jgi:hypothetical protein
MRRGTVLTDRVVCLLLGLLLLAFGAGAAVWGTDRVSPLTGPLDLGPLPDATNKTWWPWAVGVAGAVLILLGLRWLLAHVPARGTGPIRLDGSGRQGRLLADGRPIADTAAQVLAETPGVRSARGRVLRERGRVVARLDAAVEPDADLSEIAVAADEVSAQLRNMLGRPDLDCRVQLHTTRRGRPMPRVR